MEETRFTKRRTVWVSSLTNEQFVVDADNPAYVVSQYPAENGATERQAADAALDLAAPDLYEALEMLREGECFCSATARMRDFDGEHSPACIRATAALAKARGEE